jgi:hypothetical protein
MLYSSKQYDLPRFSQGLYAALISFIITAFLMSLRIASGPELQALEFGLISTSLAMFFFVTLSISYLYVHRILPDFFIRSSIFFSFFCLVAMGCTMYAKGGSHTEASKEDPARFIESGQYQIQKQKSEATYAANMLPQ